VAGEVVLLAVAGFGGAVRVRGHFVHFRCPYVIARWHECLLMGDSP
jgi:hypothetical protein